MYICKDCGTIFEYPREYRDTHGLDNPPYEEYSGCPECGGAYTETFKCCECGEYVYGEYVELKNGEIYCADCYSMYDVMD